MLGVRAELRDRLRDQDVEPVEAFRLVRVHVVVCLAEDRVCCQGRWVSEYRAALFLEGAVLCGGRGCGAEGEERAFVGEGSRASFCGSEGGGYVRGGRVPEDEEFYEGAEE